MLDHEAKMRVAKATKNNGVFPLAYRNIYKKGTMSIPNRDLIFRQLVIKFG
jgi:hypothetical protein